MTDVRFAFGMLAAVVAACGPARPVAPAPVTSTLYVGALRHGVDAFLTGHPLAPGAEIRADEVGRSEAASLHLVQVRGRETPHRHERHDLVVHVLRGAGVLHLAGERLPMRAGDVVLVRRGVAHWFAADAGAMAIALVTFAPPLDAPDSVPVPDVDSDHVGR
jgi:quercetin dioxygenase-like cupin family protein